MASSAWKSLEHKAAELFGGVRVSRGSDFSTDLPDVVCSKRWSIECKSRSKLTLWRWYDKLKTDTIKFYPGEDRIKIILSKEKGKRGELISLSTEDFFKVLRPELVKEIEEMKNQLKGERND